MNQKISAPLKEVFQAPAPKRKEAFLRTLPRPKISNRAFILMQASFLPKWVWALSLLPFAGMLAATFFIGSAYSVEGIHSIGKIYSIQNISSTKNIFPAEKSALWTLSALMPFAALSAVAGSSRSKACHMAELEMASRFSLKSVVLARMGIIGILHLLVLCLLVPLVSLRDGRALWQTGTYLLTPYLLATLLSLWCTRLIHGRESGYACLGVALLVSGLSLFTQESAAFLYRREHLSWWVAALLFLTVLTAREYARNIQNCQQFCC